MVPKEMQPEDYYIRNIGILRRAFTCDAELTTERIMRTCNIGSYVMGHMIDLLRRDR